MKGYLFIISFVILFTLISCNSKEDETTIQGNVKSSETIDTTTIENKEPQTASETNSTFISFTEKYANDFFYDTLVKVEAPDYDIVDKYGLTQIDIADVSQELFDLAHLDRYTAKVFLFNNENRLENFQDFTLFITNDYSHNIVYFVLDSLNNPVSALNLAYQLAEGEYIEDASGEFVNSLEYHQDVIGASMGYEDPDGTVSESEELVSKKYFRILPDGQIEEL